MYNYVHVYMYVYTRTLHSNEHTRYMYISLPAGELISIIIPTPTKALVYTVTVQKPHSH